MDYGEFIAALDVMDTPVTRKDTMQITKKITQVEGQIATLEGEVRHKFTLETQTQRTTKHYMRATT